MIEVINLTKRYGDKKAVDNISFKAEDGEVLGFLGPNGAGKSTTMNILTGYISCTDGKALIDGVDILEDPIKAKKQIGYLPELPPLYMDMTVKEYLYFVYDLKKCKLPKVSHLKDICGLVKIDHVYNRIIKNLSKGYRQRVGLAQALIGNPKVLILDEPTVGLDPNERVRFRNLISELSEERLVLLSTHIVSDIEYIANDIMLMKEGKLFYTGSEEDLLLSMKERVWLCEVPRNMVEQYRKMFLVGNIRTTQAGAELRIISREKPAEDAIPVEKKLEDVFLLYFGEKSEDSYDA